MAALCKWQAIYIFVLSFVLFLLFFSPNLSRRRLDVYHTSNSNTSSTCPDNMVNFGPLAAEIGLLVWGTPANFNGFRILEALLHGTLVVGVSQTLRR